ncbi:MAG: TIGR00269 family protein [Candidatus Lokiarchaeota archaeon]|nr:TIGR00269 family protein [Candidatus Lokiarchaeota archaeon]
MLHPHDKIVVALSGGKDSISLLHNLIQIQQKKFSSKPIIALSIDEGIEDYRKKSIGIAKKYCKAHDIHHVIITFKEKLNYSLDEIVAKFKENGIYKNACNYCALVRRRLLNQGALDLDADVLALGHNLTDYAETFLMNILYKRLSLISNRFLFKRRSAQVDDFYVKKITPLMRIPENEISVYVKLKNLDYLDSHCPYRKSDPIVRKKVLNFIAALKNSSPEIEFNIFNSYLKISELLYYNEEKQEYTRCEKCGYPTSRHNLCSFCNLVETLNK